MKGHLILELYLFMLSILTCISEKNWCKCVIGHMYINEFNKLSISW